MRGWLDVMVTPQLATVATMVILAVLVGTSTLSDDGSIAGMYRASLRLASQTYSHGAERADELKRATTGLVAAPQSQGTNNSGNSGQQQQSPSSTQEQKKQ
jgi:hypothetical protein